MSFQRTLLFSLAVTASAVGCHRKQDTSQGGSGARTGEGSGTSGTVTPDSGAAGNSYDTGNTGTGTTGMGMAADAGAGGQDGGSSGDAGSYGDAGSSGDAGSADAGSVSRPGTGPR